MIQGSCLCGDVAYEVQSPLLHAHHCHCGFCRKEHGTPYATYGLVPASALKWLRGEEKVVRYESSPGFHRAFCPRCGSILPGDPAGDLQFVPLGNLDGEVGVRPQLHIFTGSKADWWEIRDGLPQHAAFPPEFGDTPVFPTREAVDPPGRPRGSCLCRKVAFVIEGEARFARNCYCGRCRRARAAGHASNLVVGADDLRFTRGEDELVTYHVPGARFFRQVFCRSCGSKLPRVDPGRGIAVIPMGALDDPAPLAPQVHIFVADQAPWIGIHDALPRYEGYPPEA